MSWQLRFLCPRPCLFSLIIVYCACWMFRDHSHFRFLCSQRTSVHTDFTPGETEAWRSQPGNWRPPKGESWLSLYSWSIFWEPPMFLALGGYLLSGLSASQCGQVSLQLAWKAPSWACGPVLYIIPVPLWSPASQRSSGMAPVLWKRRRDASASMFNVWLSSFPLKPYLAVCDRPSPKHIQNTYLSLLHVNRCVTP